MRAASRLEQRGGGTPDERAAFAEELRLLLIASGQRLNVSRFMPHTPAFELSRSAAPDPVDVYTAFVERECAGVRHDALQQAAEGVMAPHQLVHWLDARPAALTSDAGCRAALAELAARPKLKARG